MGLLAVIANSKGAAPGHVTPVANPYTIENTTADGRNAFLILGDSISQGASDGDGPTPTANTVYEYYNGSIVQVGVGDLQSTATDINGNHLGSQWPQFGISYYSATGYKPVLINRGSSGSSYSNTGDSNNWLSSGANWSPLLSNVSACLSAMAVTRLKGILIICGINDARRSTALATVQTSLNDLFARLSSSFGGVPVYVVNLGRSENGISDSRIDAIRGYTTSIVAAGSNRKMAADLRDYATNHPEYYKSDLLHLNQTGCNVLGVELATYVTANP